MKTYPLAISPAVYDDLVDKYLIFYRLTEEDTFFVSRILLRSRNHWRLLLQDGFPAEWDE